MSKFALSTAQKLTFSMYAPWRKTNVGTCLRFLRQPVNYLKSLERGSEKSCYRSLVKIFGFKKKKKIKIGRLYNFELWSENKTLADKFMSKFKFNVGTGTRCLRRPVNLKFTRLGGGQIIVPCKFGSWNKSSFCITCNRENNFQ